MKKLLILLCVCLASCSKPDFPIVIEPVVQKCVIHKFFYIKEVTNNQVIVKDWYTNSGQGYFYSNNCADNGVVYDKTMTSNLTRITYTEYRLIKVN